MITMAEVTLTIDGQTISCSEDSTVLRTADTAGIYIPRMCYHPDLSPVGDMVWADTVYQVKTEVTGDKSGASAGVEAHCNLCLIEIEGQPEPVNSCVTRVENGLVVRTDSETVILRRKQALARLLADHPHACLTCAQKEGCSRTDCSANVPVEERCCSLLGRCELQKVSAYIGIPGDTPRYVPQSRPHTVDDPLFDRNYELCIGCLRCVRVCQKIQGSDILGAVWKDQRSFVGTLTGGGLREAQCRFCGACVEVCPTGALLDKDNVPAVSRDSQLPCVGNCPAGIDIPHYIRSIAAGRYQEALEIIRRRVPFPGILGYVCFRPCEDICRRAEIDQAVAICDLKRYAADSVMDGDSFMPEKLPDTGKQVAIIGSGPAGLTAAYYLGIMGHRVSVFDRESQPGGMLRHGIPDYRLPPELLDRELKVLDRLSVSFHMDHPFDAEKGIDTLKSQGFDAVLIAAGASVSKPLPIDNADQRGVFPALEFLKSAKASRDFRLDGRVVVIGGGNVAIDAAMTAMRLGARSVHLVCLESRKEMPAHSWEITQAEEEGLKILTSWGPARIESDGDRLSGVEFKKCTRVFDDRGRFAPQYDESTTKHIPSDAVIVAIGQQTDRELSQQLENLSDRPESIMNEDEPLALNQEGVFAAGDMIRGPSSVIDAIAGGRRVADMINKYLGGDGPAQIDRATSESHVPKPAAPHNLFQQPRQNGELVSPDVRKSGFSLIQLTLTEQAAQAEAHRCLQCDLRQQITPVTLPPEEWQPLTHEAVELVPESEGVFQLLNADKKVIRITGTPNIRQSLKECLENLGDARLFVWEEDPMFTKRESELIQRYLQEYGELPGGGGGDDDLDDLF